MITKEQQEIVDFTRKEFNQHTLEDRTKMYSAVLLMACMKWPEEIENFKKAFEEGAGAGWE